MINFCVVWKLKYVQLLTHIFVKPESKSKFEFQILVRTHQDPWIKIKMVQDETAHTSENHRKHSLKIKCFVHNLTDLSSQVTKTEDCKVNFTIYDPDQNSGDKNVGQENKATLKQNVHEYE